MRTAAPDTLFPGLPSERDIVAHFTVQGEPISKSRARFTKRGSKTFAYTPEKTKAGEMQIAAAFHAAGGKRDANAETTFGVIATFHHGTHQRRDVDNMLKLVLDGLNSMAWVDDNQVIEVAGRKRYVGSRDLAHTEVVVYRIGTIDRKTTRCARCRSAIRTYDSWRSNARYCGKECREAAKAEKRELAQRKRMTIPLECKACGSEFHSGSQNPPRFCSEGCAKTVGRVDIPCGICGKTFNQFRSWAARGRIYCSSECSMAHHAESRRRRRTKKFLGACAICGAGTTRKEYRRCNPCKLAGKAIPAEGSRA